MVDLLCSDNLLLNCLAKLLDCNEVIEFSSNCSIYVEVFWHLEVFISRESRNVSSIALYIASQTSTIKLCPLKLSTTLNGSQWIPTCFS